MTPEERLRRFADAEPWGVEPFRPAFRPGGVLDAPARPLPSRRAWAVGFAAVATVVVAVLVVFGAVALRGTGQSGPITPITPAPSSTPTGESTPSQTPTPTEGPTHTPPPRSDGVQPLQPFGGDCDAVLDRATVNRIVGVDVAPARLDDVLGDSLLGTIGPNIDFAVLQAGGLQCRWAQQGGSGSISLWVFPRTSITGVGSDECDDSAHTDSTTSCLIELDAGDVHYSADVWTGDRSSSKKAVAQLVTVLRAAAAHAQVRAVGALSSTQWPLPADCATIDHAVDVSKLVGVEMTLTEEGWDDFPPQGVLSLLSKDLSLWCHWSGSDRTLHVSVYSGGGWAEDEIAARPDSTPVSVPGFDHAYVVQLEQGAYSLVNTKELELFRGGNWLSVNVDERSYKPYWTTLDAIADELDREAAAAH